MTGGTAFLFPGQGTDLAAHWRQWLGRPGPILTLIDLAGDALGMDLRRLLLAGDPATARTEVAQPALVAATLGLALEREDAGVIADAVAGHSLGELTAVAFAGCLGPEHAIGAAVARGRLMGEAARRTPGAMAAVACEGIRHVEDFLSEGRRYGVLELAARNAPTQWVLSGERAALGAVAAMTPISMLPVTGPWHSQLMRDAAVEWERVLRSFPWESPRRLLVLSETATQASGDTDVPAALSAALTSPVLWMQTIEFLRAWGVSRFVSVGPGRVLKNLCRDILGPECEAVTL